MMQHIHLVAIQEWWVKNKIQTKKHICLFKFGDLWWMFTVFLLGSCCLFARFNILQHQTSTICIYISINAIEIYTLRSASSNCTAANVACAPCNYSFVWIYKYNNIFSLSLSLFTSDVRQRKSTASDFAA